MTTNEKLIITGLAVALVYVFYSVYLKGRLSLYKAKKRIKEMERYCIKNISKFGFTIYVDNVPNDVKWNEIKSIEFITEYAQEITEKMEFITEYSLEIILKKESKLMVYQDCLNRLEFIRKVPTGIDKFDYAFVEIFFGNLKPCKICGCYAIENGECLNCDYSKELERESRKEKTHEEFLKEEQLDYFTIYFDANEPVETILRKAKQNEIFKCDPQWKIYPTKQEIEEAQKEMR
jgi:hypothetical protein